MSPDPDMALEETACFCGVTETRGSVIAAKDELSGQRFDYHTCAVCGADRLSPRPRADDIGTYYPATYASHSVREESFFGHVKRLVYLAFHAPDNRLGVFRPLFRALLYPLRGHSVFAFHAIEPKRVFEFGAAVGNDLALFKAEGWDVSGCEPSARACELARERGISLQNTTAERAGLAPESVSCVLINNVLEHVHHPASVLAVAWRGLVPGGSLVVVVPNHGGWSARAFGAAWPGYDAPRHLWGFTPPSLAALMREAGFAPPAIYHLFQGRWAWQSTLDGRHAAAAVAPWRRRWSREVSSALYPFGIMAAWAGRGDFITVVATKEPGGAVAGPRETGYRRPDPG